MDEPDVEVPTIFLINCRRPNLCASFDLLAVIDSILKGWTNKSFFKTSNTLLQIYAFFVLMSAQSVLSFNF